MDSSETSSSSSSRSSLDSSELRRAFSASLRSSVESADLRLRLSETLRASLEEADRLRQVASESAVLVSDRTSCYDFDLGSGSDGDGDDDADGDSFVSLNVSVEIDDFSASGSGGGSGSLASSFLGSPYSASAFDVSSPTSDDVDDDGVDGAVRRVECASSLEVPTKNSYSAQLGQYVRKWRRGRELEAGEEEELLIHPDTEFKHFNVDEEDHASVIRYCPVAVDQEEGGPEDDAGRSASARTLRQCHEVVDGFEYVDTFFELGGSRGFGWARCRRGPDPLNVLLFNLCGAYVLHLLGEISEDLDRAGAQSGYVKLGNVLWWRGLELSADVLIIQSFGILPSILDPWSRRIYYFALFGALCGLTVAYLAVKNCVGWCFWICWLTFLGTLYSAASSPLFRLVGWRISDALFCLFFLVMSVQAVCAKEEEMAEALIMLGVGVGYAGPLGCWTPACFRIRVLIMTSALAASLPTIARHIVSPRGGGVSPGLSDASAISFLDSVADQLFQLPVLETCRLGSCFKELSSLLPNKNPLGADFVAGELDMPASGGEAVFSAEPLERDLGVLWFLLLFVAFNLFFLALPDAPSRCTKSRRPKRNLCEGRGKRGKHKKEDGWCYESNLSNVGPGGDSGNLRNNPKERLIKSL